MAFPNTLDWGEAGKVDKTQNPWVVMIDYSKSIITLASSLLALTATFATSLLGTRPSRLSVIMLLISWGFLIAAIISAMLVSAYLTNFLRGTATNVGKAPLVSNICFFCLVLALLAFGVLGFLRLWPTATAPDISVALARVAEFNFPNTPTNPKAENTVQSMTWDPGAKGWRVDVLVTYQENGAKTAHRFSVATDEGANIVEIKLK